MKLWLPTISLLAMTSCTLTKSKATSSAVESGLGAVTSSCTALIDPSDEHSVTITVEGENLSIRQSSRIARFAQLDYKISRINLFAAPAGDPKFSCGELSRGIKVWDDVAAVNGAYYSLTAAGNQNAGRRFYSICGAYNVTIEPIEGRLNDIMTINGPDGFELLKETQDDGENVIFQSEAGTNVWIRGLLRYPLRQIIYGVKLSEDGSAKGGTPVNCIDDPAHS